MNTAAMRTKKHDSELVPLDDATARWLENLARQLKTSRGKVVASMLRDIRVDDEQYNDVKTATVH